MGDWRLGRIASDAVALFSSEADAETFLGAHLASKRAQLISERDTALEQLKTVCTRLGLDPQEEHSPSGTRLSLSCTVKSLHQALQRLQSTLAERSKSVQLALTKLRSVLNEIGQTTPVSISSRRDSLTTQFEQEVEILTRRAQAEKVERTQAAEQKRRAICALLRVLGVARDARTQFDELVLVGDFGSLGLGDSSMQMLDSRLGELEREKTRRWELSMDLLRKAEAIRTLLQQENERGVLSRSKLLATPSPSVTASCLTEDIVAGLKRNLADLEALKESLLPAVTLAALKRLARTAANAALEKHRIATILSSLELGAGRRDIVDVLDDVLEREDAANSDSASAASPTASAHQTNETELTRRITSSHWPVERILTCCRDEEAVLSARASETRGILDRLQALDKLRASKADHDKLEKDPGRFKIPRYAIKAEAFRKKYATLPSRIAALAQSVEAWQTKHKDPLIVAGIDIGHHLSLWSKEHTQQLKATREARRNRLYEKRRVPAARGAAAAAPGKAAPPRKKRAAGATKRPPTRAQAARARATRASVETGAENTGASALAFAAKAIPRLLAGPPSSAK